MRLPLTAQNSAIKRCPQCRRPCIIWQHVTFCSRYTFLMVSNPDRIAPGRRLPESTQSILHHYFIRSHAGTNTYLLIIDKFLLIRWDFKLFPTPHTFSSFLPPYNGLFLAKYHSLARLQCAFMFFASLFLSNFAILQPLCHRSTLFKARNPAAATL